MIYRVEEIVQAADSLDAEPAQKSSLRSIQTLAQRGEKNTEWSEDTEQCARNDEPLPIPVLQQHHSQECDQKDFHCSLNQAAKRQHVTQHEPSAMPRPRQTTEVVTGAQRR